MAKGNRGGQRGSNINVASNIPAPPTDTDIALVDTQKQDLSLDYQKFMKMTEDEKVDAMANANDQDVPLHLANTGLQRILYNMGLEDKPEIVNDAKLDKMTGQELFRTVNYVNRSARTNDIGFKAPGVARQVMESDFTRLGAGGGTAHGEGLYFADNYGHSQRAYGNTMNNVNATCTMRAKLNKNAKVITESKASRGVQTEIANGTKLGKLLQKVDYDSRMAVYGLSKGYNVMQASSSGYYVVWTRNAMTMSSKLKPKDGNSNW